MKAVIKKTEFHKEFDSKFGTLYSHKVWYDDKLAFYSSKSKNQNKFVPGKEAEFTEETIETKRGPMVKIKPMVAGGQSNFGKALKREQSRYTTMGASYVKDLIIAGKLDIKDWEKATEKIVKFMFNLDKEIES